MTEVNFFFVFVCEKDCKSAVGSSEQAYLPTDLILWFSSTLHLKIDKNTNSYFKKRNAMNELLLFLLFSTRGSIIFIINDKVKISIIFSRQLKLLSEPV